MLSRYSLYQISDCIFFRDSRWYYLKVSIRNEHGVKSQKSEVKRSFQPQPASRVKIKVVADITKSGLELNVA